MKFAHPIWFFGLLLLPLLVLLQYWSESRRRALLGKLVALRLQPQLAASASAGKRWVRLTLILLGLASLFATLARPQWGEEVTTEKTHGRDIIIVIDTSRSMLSTDLAPNRLTRVKLAAEDLIGNLQGDRVGLVAFAGTAFLQAPLTADLSAVLASLHELDTNIIPRGGTNIAEAIHTAVDAFGKGESEDRAIVLFTDGEELDADGLAAARELKGVRIFTVGAGSQQGTIIPVPAAPGESPYVKDADGQIVKSKLDEERLRGIAEATGGFYTLLRSGPPEMKQIYENGLMQLSAHDADTQTSRRAIDRFQWPLSAALLFLIGSLFVNERRRALPPAGVLAALALFLLPAPGRATNLGLERYEEKDYAGALQHFEKQLERRPSDAVQYDVGTAAYKAGQIEKALDAFSQAIRSRDPSLRGKAEYNLGNTLFQRGSAQKERPPKIQDWKNSLQHYDEALRVDPKNENATFNRNVLLKLLEEQEQEQKKEDQKKDEEKKKDQEKKEGDKGGKQDQKDKGKDGEKKEGDQESKDGENQKGENGQSKDGKGDQKDRDKKEGKDQESQEQEGQKPKQGEIQSTEKGKEEQARKAQEAAEQKEAAEEAEAAAAGKMTEVQARSLLDSLKSEDDRVRLLNPKQKGPRDSTIRDW